MSDLPRLQTGEARAFCIKCGPIDLDSLTAIHRVRRHTILHLPCGNRVKVHVGPETKIVIHSFSCGHAIAVPYREGQAMPPSPGCAALHLKEGPVI